VPRSIGTLRLSCPDTPLMCGVGSLFHDSAAAVDIKPTGCRSWTCDICAPLRKARCEIQARRGQPTKFLTLTCNPRIGASPADRRKRMGAAFPLLIHRMERYLKIKIEYFAVTEQHKSGEPHLHILLRCGYVPQQLISKWWNELTGAFRVDIRQIKDKTKAAKYIAKYLNKGLHKFGTSKRYWMSRGWELPPGEGEKPTDWQPRKWSWSKEYADDIEWGYLLRGWWRVPGEIERGVRRLMWPKWGTGPPPGLAGSASWR
jgi:hypothetical protein